MAFSSNKYTSMVLSLQIWAYIIIGGLFAHGCRVFIWPVTRVLSTWPVGWRNASSFNKPMTWGFPYSGTIRWTPLDDQCRHHAPCKGESDMPLASFEWDRRLIPTCCADFLVDFFGLTAGWPSTLLLSLHWSLLRVFHFGGDSEHFLSVGISTEVSIRWIG